ncbi:Pentatricopeptide repeat-containing protein [Artemisia annua]|uniref:Pentatricopeptide repeat-containing protein n=1 Tax=Artemisia annua TaxID=35608 RepID=A0A2U1KAM5_ARTAN|nr:Pentatricopeptide repeat-containing protein [Artemisia annua]
MSGKKMKFLKKVFVSGKDKGFFLGMMDEVIEGVEMMCGEKFRYPFDNFVISSVVKAFVNIGEYEVALAFYDNAAKCGGFEMNVVSYTCVLSAYCRLNRFEEVKDLKGKVDEALRVFKLVENSGMGLDEFVYATLIDGFCKVCDFDSVFRLLDEMKEKGVHPSVVTYNIIINGLCKCGRTNEAYKVSKGIDGDVITYSTLLHGYIKEKDLTGVIITKKRLEECGVRMDVVMCNVLIKALFLVGSFEDVNIIYKGMPEMGLTPNDVTFCTLVDGYCKLGRIEEALEIFDEFRRTSIDSVACYNCIINGLCKNEMIDMAIQVFLELIERGMPSDPSIYRILLQSILKAKGPEGILDLVSKVENMGGEGFHIVCDYALCFLCDGGFIESVNDMYTFMKRNGMLLTKASYNSLVELALNDQKLCLLKIPLSDLVKEFGISDPRVSKIVLNHLCMKDVGLAIKFLETKTITFPVYVLEMLIKNGRAHDAFDLLMGSKEKLPFMDVVDYTILVDGLCKEGHIRKALEVCTLARNNKVTLNIVTYNTIINGLCHQGCFVEAFRLFDSLEMINVIPSEITYCTLIDALCKEGYLLDANKLFEKMVLKNLKPNIRVYNSLINGYSKLGRLPEVLKLVADLDENGIRPDEFTVSVVINTFCRNGNMEGALEYYSESRANGFSPDLLGFFYLIRGLCSKGRMEESRGVLRDMLETDNVLDLLKKVDTGSETESVDLKKENV